jgi:hypothetical protein
MNFIAVFDTYVGGSDGAYVESDSVSTLKPIGVEIDGYPIRIVPLIAQGTETEYDNDQGPLEYQVDYLQVLRAEVTVATDRTTLEGADLKTFYQGPRAAAAEALRRSLSHLRAVTGDVSVDTRMRGLRLTHYLDEAGNDVYPRPVWDSFRLPEMSFVGGITSKTWDQIAQHVTNNDRIPFSREWLLDARAFLAVRNYNMALAAAAVACELTAFELLRRALTDGERVSQSQAMRFLDRVSKQDLLPTLLAFFEIADQGMIDSLKLVFEDRNKIMHGQRVAQVRHDHACAAVGAAEFLEARLQKLSRLA